MRRECHERGPQNAHNILTHYSLDVTRFNLAGVRAHYPKKRRGGERKALDTRAPLKLQATRKEGSSAGCYSQIFTARQLTSITVKFGYMYARLRRLPRGHPGAPPIRYYAHSTLSGSTVGRKTLSCIERGLLFGSHIYSATSTNHIKHVHARQNILSLLVVVVAGFSVWQEPGVTPQSICLFVLLIITYA